jgi:hypothetical protein
MITGGMITGRMITGGMTSGVTCARWVITGGISYTVYVADGMKVYGICS